MSKVISWEDPPGWSAAETELREICDEVRARPDEWALAFENLPMKEAEKLRASLRRVPGFKVKRRDNGDDTHNLYLQYTPQEVSA